MVRLSDQRPWGWFHGVGFERWWIKLIRVYPGEVTSSQYHRHRDELHWRLPFRLRYVRRMYRHRLTEGWYIEFAKGRPREDDIIRIRDRYGRCNKFKTERSPGNYW